MNRRSFLKSANLAGMAILLPGSTLAEDPKKVAVNPSSDPKTILLKDYRPRSIYKVPVTDIAKAKFPIIDMHSHPYPKTEAEITTWLRNMDDTNVEKTIILSMSTGKAFDAIYGGAVPDRAFTALTDTRFYGLNYNIPSLCFGASGAAMHGFNEYVDLESLKKATKAMALFIAEWCGVEKA